MAKEAQPQVSYTVEELVEVNPYNPDILSDLENYVNEQVSSQKYSLDANLCLLRLYQFEPERMSIPIVARILIKALMAMPAQDFSLCLFLIPEQVQMEEQFKTLIVLSHYLETAWFRQFWDEAAKNRSLLESVPGFEQAIQSYAIHVLSLTYQKVPRTVLAESDGEKGGGKGSSGIFEVYGELKGMLDINVFVGSVWKAINMEGLSLDKFLENRVADSGWVIEKSQGRSQLILLPPNEFNHPELKKNPSDSVSFKHVTRIFPVLS